MNTEHRKVRKIETSRSFHPTQLTSFSVPYDINESEFPWLDLSRQGMKLKNKNASTKSEAFWKRTWYSK